MAGETERRKASGKLLLKHLSFGSLHHLSTSSHPHLYPRSTASTSNFTPTQAIREFSAAIPSVLETLVSFISHDFCSFCNFPPSIAVHQTHHCHHRLNPALTHSPLLSTEQTSHLLGGHSPFLARTTQKPVDHRPNEPRPLMANWNFFKSAFHSRFNDRLPSAPSRNVWIFMFIYLPDRTR